MRRDLGSVGAQGVAGELGLERAGERLGRREVGMRRQHRELVAAQARDDVALAQPPRQHPRDVAQQLVAGVVARVSLTDLKSSRSAMSTAHCSP